MPFFAPLPLTESEYAVLKRITEAACRDPSIPLDHFLWTKEEKRSLWRAFKKLAKADEVIR